MGTLLTHETFTDYARRSSLVRQQAQNEPVFMKCDVRVFFEDRSRKFNVY